MCVFFSTVPLLCWTRWCCVSCFSFVCVRGCVCVVAVLAVVLLRCYVVVSQDSVYMRDVRYFHRFGDMYVLRDEEIREATVAQLEVFMPTHTHTHSLTHSNNCHISSLCKSACTPIPPCKKKKTTTNLTRPRIITVCTGKRRRQYHDCGP